MRNKVIAILMIVVIFVSMIPINVFAATTTTLNEIKWVKSTINGEVYKIEYWHPEGLPNIRITNRSSSANWKHYYITYYSDSAQFTGKNDTHITNDIIISMNQNGYGYMSPYIKDVENNMMHLIFTNDATYRKNTFTQIDTTDGSTHQYTGTDILDIWLDSKYENFENQYAEWYFSTYGNYPPLASDGEEIEYMQGSYYAILKQEIQITGGGASFDGNKHYSGFVDTCDDVKLKSEDGAYVYVVISSEHNTADMTSFVDIARRAVDLGELFNPLDWAETLIECISLGFIEIDRGQEGALGVMHRLTKLSDELGENRNNYKFFEHEETFFYDQQYKLNRYYFSNLKDACKFVLYGTAGAKYQHKEIGKTRYGYGYTEVVYNNYEIGTWGITTIPQDSYPLKRAQVMLRWHEENTAKRPYLLIEFDYYPYASIIGTDSILRISKNLNPTYKIAYRTEENEENWNASDRSIYVETNEYDSKQIQKFYIFSSDIEDIYKSTSWDIIFSTFSIYKAEGDKNNAGIGDLTEQEEAYSKLTDTEGNIYLENKETGEIFKENELDDPYKDPDGDGIYENSKGDTINKNELTNPMEEWRESILNYQSSLSKISDILEDFTDILNENKKDVKELTDLLNAFFSSLPIIFRSLIIFVILSIIITRITRRA